MHNLRPIGAIAVAVLLTAAGPAGAFDDAKYPNLKGAWDRTEQGAPRFDPSKPRGLAQQPPLTPEYMALYKQSLAGQEAAGQDDDTVFWCLPWGMPAMMNGYAQIELIVEPDITYMLIDDGNDSVRRIFTDGRNFPDDAEPSFVGYSIGRWVDTTGGGRYDLLEIETRNFKGPRVYDSTGLMLHPDSQSVIKERIYLDKSNSNLLHDQITVEDHALTHPWTVMKDYKRDPKARPDWVEDVCAENSNHVMIGGETVRDFGVPAVQVPAEVIQKDER